MADEARPRRFTKAGCGCALAVLFGLVLVVLLAVVFVWSVRARQAVEAELAQIRAAGEPVTPEDLERMYDQSGADPELARQWLAALAPLTTYEYRTAAKNLPIVGESEAEIPPPGEPWPDLAAAEALLQKYGATLQQIHALAERGGAARYPTDFASGSHKVFENTDSIFPGVALLMLECEVHARRGNARSAARSVHAALELTASLEHYPASTSLHFRYVLERSVARQVACLLANAALGEDDLRVLQTHLRRTDAKEAMRRALFGDRVVGMWAFEELSKEYSGLLRDEDLSAYLRFVRSLVASTQEPWSQMWKAVDQAEQVLTQECGANVLGRLRFPVSKTLGSELIGIAAARNEALRCATDAAIAIEIYRRETGRLPERLDQLVPKFLPEVPADPFDGKPLRYAVRDGGYVLYSVGEDEIDNGGDGGELDIEPDIVFRVQRPKPPANGRSGPPGAEVVE